MAIGQQQERARARGGCVGEMVTQNDYFDENREKVIALQILVPLEEAVVSQRRAGGSAIFLGTVHRFSTTIEGPHHLQAFDISQNLQNIFQLPDGLTTRTSSAPYHNGQVTPTKQ